MRRLPLIFLLLISLTLLSCKKSGKPPVVVIGTVIGFDQCSADIEHDKAHGYAIKIDSITTRGDTITIDTVVTYNLPNIFEFAHGIFNYYQFDFLFPDSYRNKYRFEFSYTVVPDDKKNYPLCKADIFLEPFEAATKGKQITITNNYGIIP
ncbi:MAG: hypothetical protein KGO81_12950 [Bacteroidota bacterium]|nr:hypothetical protein [Bacteroidota bacterium]